MTPTVHPITDFMTVGWVILSIFGGIVTFALLVKGSMGKEEETGITVGHVFIVLAFEILAIFTAIGLSHSH